jgi:hypothetical protein
VAHGTGGVERHRAESGTRGRFRIDEQTDDRQERRQRSTIARVRPSPRAVCQPRTRDRSRRAGARSGDPISIRVMPQILMRVRTKADHASGN